MVSYLHENKLRTTFFLIILLTGIYFLHSLSAESFSRATGESYFPETESGAYLVEFPGESPLEYESGNTTILPVIAMATNNNLRKKDVTNEEYNNDYYSLPMIYPVPGNFRISSRFGMRKDPFSGHPAFHNGIDIPLRAGTPVRATGNGYCYATGTDSLLGTYIIINHNGEYESIYGHLSTVKVRRGQLLKSGEIIGASGNTGRSTNPHLHYQINHFGQPVDPVKIKEELNELRWVMRN